MASKAGDTMSNDVEMDSVDATTNSPQMSPGNVELYCKDDSPVLEANSTLPKASHVEISIQEDVPLSQSSGSAEMDSRVLNVAVSCPTSSENADPNAEMSKMYTVLYSCNKCSFCADNLSELKLHAQKKHLESEKQDGNPGNNDNESNRTIELEIIDYACNKCSFKTNRSHTYREHLLTHTKIGAKEMFKCLDCDYSTRHKYNLKTHLKRHAKIGELSDDEIFRCGKCDYVSPYKHDLMTHVKKHDPEKPFQCEQCDFQSIYKHSLIHHVRSKHDKLRPFKCDQCNYSSARKQDLQTHMGHHADEKKFKCDRCDYATPYRISFKAHMDRHMGNKLFKCDHEGCDFATTTKQNLKSHDLRHSTVKPLKCMYCDYTAAHKQQIVNHELKHGVADPPTKRYTCISCDYSTAHRYSLQRHMNRHNMDRKMPEKEFICNECGYSTGYKNSLKRHMAKHSDVKPFKCGHCDYSAINMTQMHVHIAKHTGIKPFKCELCDYATANKQHLVGHMAKHSTVRLNCTLCNFSTAWKQRMRAHRKAHENGTLYQQKDLIDGSAQTGKIFYAVPGSSIQASEDDLISDKEEALNQISNAIQAFHTYNLQREEDLPSSEHNTSVQVLENGHTYASSRAAGSVNPQANIGTKIALTDFEQVQLIDEDGNKMAGSVQCVNGKQTIKIVASNGVTQTVDLDELQKDGAKSIVWEQTEEADGTRHIRSVPQPDPSSLVTRSVDTTSPAPSNSESESDVSLLVIDEKTEALA